MITEHLGMVCRHGDENTANSDDVMTRACRILDLPDTERAAFTTAAVYWLNWRHDAYIHRIACDAWAGVWVRTYGRDTAGEDEDMLEIVVQCDDVEDGIAAIIIWLDENRTPRDE